MGLVDAGLEFQQPFTLDQIPLDTIYYLGESVLLREYRGQGIGKRFFELREQQARVLGAETCAFCSWVDHEIIPQKQATSNIYAAFGGVVDTRRPKFKDLPILARARPRS